MARNGANMDHVPGWATVRGLSETGGRPVGDREVELALDVRADGRSYSVRHRQMVSRIAADDLHLGSVLSVEIDPGDPQRLVIR